jgi:phosphoglycerate dehydrogenase-like enzyme
MLLFPECVEGVFAKVHSYGECSERFTMASCLGQNGIEESTMVFTLAADVDQRPVVIDGAGTLGRRIATVYTAGGSDVRIFDLSAEQREAARD